MKRSAPLQRSGRLHRTVSLRRSGRLRSVIYPLDPTVYRVVDERSRGWCEVVLDGLICLNRARDHHHVRKPRRRFHAPEYVMAICRPHHEAVDRPYALGRLETLPLGDGRFACAIVTAPDKWAVRR